MEGDKYKIIEYEFQEGYRVAILEEILKEFKVETKVCWWKDLDFFDKPQYIFREPDYPDLYNIHYTILYEVGNKDHEFADTLIDSYLSYIGYIEKCLTKEDEND